MKQGKSLQVGIAGLLSAVFATCVAAPVTIEHSNYSMQELASSDLLLLGPVSDVDNTHEQFRVLGQAVPARVPTSVQDAQALQDRLVAVYGTVNPDGSIKVAEVKVLDSAFVPGATEIYVKGVISSANPIKGEIRIGSIKVNYSGALHAVTADQLVQGHSVVITGLTYAPTGSVYADDAMVLSGAVPASQIGTGVVEPLSQIGTGKAAPASQIGTGVVKPLSQIGTGAVKPLSQIGTDRAAPASQIGTSVVKPLSQIGTGAVKPLSQIGTGKVAPASQIGTGVVKPLSQIGTGAVKPLSQIGTGRSEERRVGK